MEKRKKNYSIVQFHKEAKQVLLDRNFSIPDAELEVSCSFIERSNFESYIKFQITYTDDPRYKREDFERNRIYAYGYSPKETLTSFDRSILKRMGINPNTDPKYYSQEDVDLPFE